MPNTYLLIDTETVIRASAERYGIGYVQAAWDVPVHHIMRPSGDRVTLDKPAPLALERAGHLTTEAAARSHGKHLRAKYE